MKEVTSLGEIKARFRDKADALRVLEDVRASMNNLMDNLNEEIATFTCEEPEETCSKCEQRAFAIEQVLKLRG